MKEPHFEIMKKLRNSSYEKRYVLFCQRLVRERLYDGVSFLMSDRGDGLEGYFREPSSELSFRNFVASLSGHAIAYVKTHPMSQEKQGELFWNCSTFL